jgi:serine/threonine protein kinase
LDSPEWAFGRALAIVSPRMPAPPKRPRTATEAPDISVEPLRYNAGDVVADKYRLEELMGKGAMGSVWRAKNLSLGVDVALKLVHGEIVSAETTDRLQREAHAAARLEHPSAVRIFDFGLSDLGDPFIAMELLRGESLRDVLERRRKIPAAEMVALALPVMSALAAAHQKGIIHRDLKPENIVIVPQEDGVVPKIVDFGLAHVESAVDEDQITSGVLVGSPDYMSPEQARADADQVGARSDVWAIGVILYEAISGTPPFSSTSLFALLRAINELDPPALETTGEADAQLGAIVMRALAKDPAARWQSMKSFGKALAEWALAH